ncbi:MAG: Zn-dependent protease [Pseudozobellia sp.]|nr:Zn-dependent protease [Pseudozobellia sp.]|tara:strand:- start:194240 stop:195232 length:993 start_codon:yes stop_codon:yes gene_type:complete
MKALQIIVFLVVSLFSLNAIKAQGAYKDQFAHTFSIVARDSITGEMAVGVQSHWFSVGTIVAWGKSGVGVVATQSFVNPAYGPEGLALMQEGKSARQALEMLTAKDEGKNFRQLGFLDHKGNVASFTGKNCVASAEHFEGNNFAVQANMMLNDNVVPAMVKAYIDNADLPLAERVVKTMLVAQEAGGDIRGKQSAALIVVNGSPVENIWEDKKVDLRVDDSPEPLQELERLLKVHRAYEHMNRGDLAVEANDMTTALEEYGAAQKMFPDNLEMKYWTAIALANGGKVNEALPIFKDVFSSDGNWKTLTKRLPESGLLTVSEGDLKKIMEQ